MSTLIFNPIYDIFVSNADINQYNLIFAHLAEQAVYLRFELLLVLIPLVCWFLFYFVWKYPYGKIKHWIVWLIITVVILFLATHNVAHKAIFDSHNMALNESIADTSTGYDNFASSLPGKFAFINSMLGLIISIIYCFIMKQFSKVQTHLPV